MSSSDRRTFLGLIAALPLAACGFAPAYGPDGGASALRGRLQVQAPQSRTDFDFISRIAARLGSPTDPAYDLGYSISALRHMGGITANNVITRYSLHGTATWTLTERQSGTRVAGGTVRAFTSWSTTGTTVAGLAAEDDAYRRLSVMLADQVIQRLIAVAPDLPR